MRQFVKRLASDSKDSSTFGEPDEWELDFPWAKLKIAFWLFAVSGFTRLPPLYELERGYPPEYVSDIELLLTIYSHQTNQSTVMRLFDTLNAYEQEPEKWRALQTSYKQRDNLYDALGIPTHQRE